MRVQPPGRHWQASLAGFGGRRVSMRGRTRRGERRRRGEREDLLAELVGLEEEPGPVLAQVLEQVLDLPLQPGDLALGEVRLGEELP